MVTFVVTGDGTGSFQTILIRLNSVAPEVEHSFVC